MTTKKGTRKAKEPGAPLTPKIQTVARKEGLREAYERAQQILAAPMAKKDRVTLTVSVRRDDGTVWSAEVQTIRGELLRDFVIRVKVAILTTGEQRKHG